MFLVLKYWQLFKHFNPMSCWNVQTLTHPSWRSERAANWKRSWCSPRGRAQRLFVQSDNSSVLSEPPSDSIHVTRAFSIYFLHRLSEQNVSRQRCYCRNTDSLSLKVSDIRSKSQLNIYLHVWPFSSFRLTSASFKRTKTKIRSSSSRSHADGKSAESRRILRNNYSRWRLVLKH